MALDYRITAFDTPTAKVGTVIFDPRVRRYISAGKLSLKDTDVDSMTMTVNPASPLYGHVQPMQTHVEVKLNGSLIFRGRVLKPTRGMADGGAFSQSFSIESVEAYLMDTRQRQGEYHNISPKDFLAHLLEVHNSAVPSYKQFKLGDVTVTDPNDSIYRYTGYDTTWQTINDKLITPLGGFLRVRFETDGMYLDYLAEVGDEHPYDNPIKLGRNLKSATVDIDPTKVITRLIPLGATIQQEAAEGETADANGTQPRVTVASANGDKDYIDIPELQAEFGVIEGTVEWDDVNDPKILLSKAQDWVKTQVAATESWQITALELGDGRFTSFNVSDSYGFLAPQINPNSMLRVIQKDIDFLNPHSSSLTIGDKSMTLTAYQRQNRLAQRQALQTVQDAKAQAATARTVATQASAEAKTATATATTAQTTADAAQKAVASKVDQSDLDGMTDDIATAKSNASTALDTANKASTAVAQASADAATATAAAKQASDDAAAVSATATNASKTASQASADAKTAVATATKAQSTADAASSAVAGKANQSDVDDLSKSVSAATANASTALTNANSALSTAKTASSTADTAKATADAASKAVDTVTATAESASTTATQAGKDAASALTKATAAEADASAAKTAVAGKADKSAVDDLTTKVTAASSTATAANTVATQASKDAAKAQTSADAANAAAGKAQTQANTATTNAATAQTAANKAQTTADTANKTATTAQSTATTANTNAGKAQTAASNAQSTANAAKSAIAAISQTVPGDQAGDLLAVSAQGLSIFAGGEAGQALTTAIKAGTPPAALVTLNGGKITPSSEMSIVVADGPIAFGVNYNNGGTTGTWWGIDTQNRLAAYKTNGTILRYVGTYALEPSQDIHTVIIEGDYTLNGAVASHANLPETTLYGTLSVRVSPSGSLITHIFIASDGNMWTEASINGGKTWSAWVKH